MTPRTRSLLGDINRRFYASQADDFATTREHPWPGWARVVARVGPLSVGFRTLDIGCGNGRLGRYLASQAEPGANYLGVDASAELLTRAQRDTPDATHFAFERRDILEDVACSWLSPGRFDFIAVFGFLHHVPGREERRRLLQALAGGLRPGGHLAVSFWRFAAFERFRRRIQPWAEYNARAEATVELDDLESGDTLLHWGESGVSPRYCHAMSDSELDALLAVLAGMGVPVVDRFDADGKEGALNRYVVLQRPVDASS